PFVAARIISGWAALRAAAATVWSPAAIASSTLRMKLRTRERRDLLTRVRAAILRVAFFAESVLAIDASLQNLTQTPPSPCRVTATCHSGNSGAISENHRIGFPDCGAAYSGKPRGRQRGFCIAVVNDDQRPAYASRQRPPSPPFGPRWRRAHGRAAA